MQKCVSFIFDEHLKKIKKNEKFAKKTKKNSMIRIKINQIKTILSLIYF